MGSMLIDTVNGEKVCQYVQSMPKLQYLREIPQAKRIDILDKLDGSNITLYPLRNYEGEIIEVVPKTRRSPVAMEKAINQVNEVITEGHKALAYKGLTASYELWGPGHPIKGGVQYFRFGDIDEFNLTGLCIYDENGNTLRPKSRDLFFDTYKIEKAQPHFTLEWEDDVNPISCLGDPFYSKGKPAYRLLPTDFLYERFNEWLPGYDPLVGFMDWCACDLESLYGGLECFYEQLNRNFAEDKQTPGLIATEGSVWHIDDGEQTIMLKDKAVSVKENHQRAACGIEGKFITKALEKAKMEIRVFNKKNFKEILKFVEEELLEEFPEELVKDKKTETKTLSRLVQMTKKIKIDEGARRFVEAIEKEVGEDANINMKMKVFAQMFREDKKQWGAKVFNYLKNRSD